MSLVTDIPMRILNRRLKRQRKKVDKGRRNYRKWDSKLRAAMKADAPVRRIRKCQNKMAKWGHRYTPKWERKLARTRELRRQNKADSWKPQIITSRQLNLKFQYLWGAKGALYRFAGHYSGGRKATGTQDLISLAVSFHNHHNSIGHGGGAYEAVAGEDAIVLLNPVDRKSAAVAAQNTGMANICVPGTTGHKLSPGEKRTVLWYIENAHTTAIPKEYRLSKPIRSLDRRGHKEFPGQSTACPGAYLPDYKEIWT